MLGHFYGGDDENPLPAKQRKVLYDEFYQRGQMLVQNVGNTIIKEKIQQLQPSWMNTDNANNV